MKLKYRNITVPLMVNDSKKPFIYYIYNNKEYSDFNELFNDFIGSYLTYHFEIKGKEKEVHNLKEVVEALVKNKESFKIPKKYIEEYSEEEYKYIFNLQKKLLNDKLKLELEKDPEFKYKVKDFNTKKLYTFYKETYDKYQNVKIPKKVHSDIYNIDYFVIAGRAYDNIFNALEEVYQTDLYYQFGGTKNPNNRTHFHAHNFEELIGMVFTNNKSFKIHVFQRQFYSKQELEFLSKLSDRLKKMNYHSPERKNDIDVEEYFYLKDNKKLLKLLFYNIKYYISDKQYNKEVLKAHKI